MATLEAHSGDGRRGDLRPAAANGPFPAPAGGTEFRDMILGGGEGWPLEFRPPEGTVLFRNPLAGLDREIILFDYANASEVRRFPRSLSLGHNTLSLDSQWLAGNDGKNRVHFTSPFNKANLPSVRAHRDEIVGLAWLADSKRLISWARDGRVCLWEIGAAGGKPALRGTYENEKWIFTAVAPSPDGSRAAAAEMGHVVLLDAADNPMQLIRRLPRISGPHYHRKIGLNTFHDDITGRQYDAFPGEPEPGMCFTSLAYFPDGHKLVTGSEDCTVLVLDAEAGKELARHHDKAGGRTGIQKLSVSPDGKFVLFAAATGPVGLWDWGAGRLAARFERHLRVGNGARNEAAISALGFTPDGRHALCGGEGGTIRIWDVPQ